MVDGEREGFELPQEKAFRRRPVLEQLAYMKLGYDVYYYDFGLPI